ncbi:hypothetical protein D3C71_1860820 [compost metagenome]
MVSWNPDAPCRSAASNDMSKKAVDTAAQMQLHRLARGIRIASLEGLLDGRMLMADAVAPFAQRPSGQAA